MGAEFIAIFSQMGLVSIITLVVGVALLVAEMFLPSFGVCSILGVISMIVGVIFRIVDGASFFQAAILVVIVLLIIIGAVILIIKLSDKGKTKTPLFQSSTAIPTDYGQKDYVKLVGKKGTITSQCKPVGKAEIEGKTYEVMAKDGFLIQGEQIVVNEVSGDEIFVTKVQEGDK